MSEEDHVTVDSIEDIVETQNEAKRRKDTPPKETTKSGGKKVKEKKQVKFEEAESDADSDEETNDPNDTVTAIMSIISTLFSTLKRYAIELFLIVTMFIVFTKSAVNTYLGERIDTLIPLSDSQNGELLKSALIGTLFAVSLLVVKFGVSFIL